LSAILLFLFVFVEGARRALSLAGTMLGYYPVRILPLKTAILPFNPTYLPKVSDVINPFYLYLYKARDFVVGVRVELILIF